MLSKSIPKSKNFESRLGGFFSSMRRMRFAAAIDFARMYMNPPPPVAHENAPLGEAALAKNAHGIRTPAPRLRR